MSASQNFANPKIKSPRVEVVALALRHLPDGKYLLARRGPGGTGAGFWEFPGGKIEPGETQKEALRREILEELSFDLASLELSFIGENVHSYDNRDIKIYLWKAKVAKRPTFKLVDHDIFKWCSVDEIKEIKLSEADKYFISLI